MSIDKFTENGFTVKIYYDESPESPRDWTVGAQMVMSHRNYDLPNDAGISFDDFEGWREIALYLTQKQGALMVMPVYMIEHSGVALRVGAGGNPFWEDPGEWDSGIVGLAYVTPQTWADTQGEPAYTGSEEDQEQARNLITSDVEVYGQYLNGEVYGYTITDTDGEVMDSLWGMYGYEYAENEARAAAKALEHEVKCNGTLNRRTGLIDHEGTCPLHAATALVAAIKDARRADAILRENRERS